MPDHEFNQSIEVVSIYKSMYLMPHEVIEINFDLTLDCTIYNNIIGTFSKYSISGTI